MYSATILQLLFSQRKEATIAGGFMTGTSKYLRRYKDRIFREISGEFP